MGGGGGGGGGGGPSNPTGSGFTGTGPSPGGGGNKGGTSRNNNRRNNRGDVWTRTGPGTGTWSNNTFNDRDGSKGRTGGIKAPPPAPAPTKNLGGPAGDGLGGIKQPPPGPGASNTTPPPQAAAETPTKTMTGEAAGYVGGGATMKTVTQLPSAQMNPEKTRRGIRRTGKQIAALNWNSSTISRRGAPKGKQEKLG